MNCGDRGSNYSAAERRGVSEVNFGFAEKNVVPKTFNGAGQVKRSEGLERKKAQMKKEEIPVKMKSPSDKKIESAKKLTTPL